MNKYVISDAFANISEYDNYTLPKLFFRGKLIGKPITDNWQHRFLKSQVEQGIIRKAKLNHGFKFYEVTAYINTNGAEYEFSERVIADNVERAKTAFYEKVLGKQFSKFIATTHSVVKLSVVQLNDN